MILEILSENLNGLWSRNSNVKRVGFDDVIYTIEVLIVVYVVAATDIIIGVDIVVDIDIIVNI